MKYTIFFCCLLLVSCFKEPKKKEIKEVNVTIVDTTVKNVKKSVSNNEDNRLVGIDDNIAHKKLTQFKEEVEKLKNSFDKSNLITINNLENLVKIFDSEKLNTLLTVMDFRVATIEKTKGISDNYSNVFYNDKNDFLRYVSDSDFTPIGIISFHPKDKNVIKDLYNDCISKNYKYTPGLSGNILHNQKNLKNIVGFSSNNYIIYFSDIKTKEPMFTIELK